METTTVKYFDGKSAGAKTVRIVLFNESLQLFDDASDVFLETIAMDDCHTTFVNGVMYLYLNTKSTSYIVVEKEHPFYEQLKEGIGKPKNWFSKLMKQGLPALLGMFAILVIAAYFLFVELVSFIGIRLISKKSEISLGNKFYTSFTSEEKVDSNASKTLQLFADHLNLSSDYPVKLTVIKEDQVNAFALPGGHIVVYSGIIDRMENYEELVALLGHEVSHVNKRHSLKGMLRNISSSILISLVAGDINGISAVLVRNANTLQNLSFSRKLEKEADDEGMNVMLQNHIDPEGMQELMAHLQKANSDIPSGLSFLSSHPLTEDRIKNAKQFILKHPQQKQTHTELEALWKKLKEE